MDEDVKRYIDTIQSIHSQSEDISFSLIESGNSSFEDMYLQYSSEIFNKPQWYYLDSEELVNKVKNEYANKIKKFLLEHHKKIPRKQGVSVSKRIFEIRKAILENTELTDFPHAFIINEKNHNIHIKKITNSNKCVITINYGLYYLLEELSQIIANSNSVFPGDDKVKLICLRNAALNNTKPTEKGSDRIYKSNQLQFNELLNNCFFEKEIRTSNPFNFVDSFAENLSNSLLNGALLFLFLHEYAHIILNHEMTEENEVVMNRGFSSYSVQEHEADILAMNIARNCVQNNLSNLEIDEKTLYMGVEMLFSGMDILYRGLSFLHTGTYMFSSLKPDTHPLSWIRLLTIRELYKQNSLLFEKHTEDVFNDLYILSHGAYVTGTINDLFSNKRFQNYFREKSSIARPLRHWASYSASDFQSDFSYYSNGIVSHLFNSVRKVYIFFKK